ncbi:hypothetical protein [Kitasatospora sp. SUK 42]|uniref:hypothetical protein n=1 Tax=Kitasatospora sp. SUK 42 TaxID=1588882 RepID=UPI0018CB71A2|nr:hypothetical protein [Kitasatospora sp. SUK 42]MBV2156470.1 hypothetical protein [Kitasatospora sp. SUK 42]
MTAANEADEQSWYAVRCVFQWNGRGGTYEERLTLWRAASADEAISRAENEAHDYARDNGHLYMGLAQSYHLATDGRPGDGDEVFSLLRDSHLDGDAYLDRYFDTGDERQHTAPGPDPTSSASAEHPEAPGSRTELVSAIKQAAEAGVWRGTGNLYEEALENIEHFPAPPTGSEIPDREALAAALADTVEAWRRDAASDGTGRPGVIYSWYDDQARQLRMSFVSGGRGDIPFRAPLRFVDRAQDVVDAFLAGEYRDPDTPLKVFALELAGEA